MSLGLRNFGVGRIGRLSLASPGRLAMASNASGTDTGDSWLTAVQRPVHRPRSPPDISDQQ